MSEIKLGNGAEVLARLKKDQLLKPNRHKTYKTLVECMTSGVAHFSEESMKNNSKLIVNCGFAKPEKEQ